MKQVGYRYVSHTLLSCACAKMCQALDLGRRAGCRDLECGCRAAAGSRFGSQNVKSVPLGAGRSNNCMPTSCYAVLSASISRVFHCGHSARS